MARMNVLDKVRNIFLLDANHWPLFKVNQKIAGNPSIKHG